MPKKTYTHISSISLAATSNSVTLGSVPQNFRDLILVGSGSITSSGLNDVYLRLNGDTGANYANVQMTTNGSIITSNTFDNTSIRPNFYGRWGTTAGGNSVVFQIMDYSAIDKHKTVLSRMNGDSDGIAAGAGRWANTSAVTSLVCFTGAVFAIGSTFTLYGIEA
jgi:hypothetical protein